MKRALPIFLTALILTGCGYRAPLYQSYIPEVADTSRYAGIRPEYHELAALMENAAYSAVAPILDVGDTTVGGEICLRHTAPSPVGAEVSATAVLERTEGRKFCFSLKAYQGETLIGEGTHTRFVVNTGRFLQKIKGSL